MTAALDAAHAAQAAHYDARCPKCRQTLKVSLKQLKQAVPGWKPTGAAPGEAAAPPAGEDKTPVAPPPPDSASAPETPPKARGKAKSKKSA